MNEAATLIAAAVGHLNARRFGAAVESYLAALRLDPREEQSWLGLALALALDGRLGDVVGLAGERERQRQDGFLFCHAVLGTMVSYKLYDHVLALDRALPDASPFAPAAAYNAGCAALRGGYEVGAFERSGRFKRLRAERRDTLPIGPESHFNVAYRQGSLIEDRGYVVALGEGPAEPVPIDWPSPPMGGGETILAAACDANYFRLFAPGFVGSLGRIMPSATAHIHVIAPAADLAEQTAHLAAMAPGVALNVSTEPAGPYLSGAYYASNRFLAAPALIERYGRPVVLTDIDIEFMAPLDELLAAAAPYDFAGFRHDGAGPASRYPAVLTRWTPAERSRVLLDRLGRFIRSKLDIPWPFNWMLDQAALVSVLRWARLDRPEIELGIVNDLLGRHFQPWIRPVGGEEKAALIRAGG